MNAKNALLRAWLGGLAASLAGLAAGLAIGPSSTPIWQLVTQAIAGNTTATVILVDVRAPRTVGAWLVGAALALAGALLQTATHNSIADPYLVGTSAGATLAAVSAVPILTWIASQTGADVGEYIPWFQPVAAFGGALLAVSIAFRLARRASAERVLVAGLVITAFAGAATSFVLTQLSDIRLRAATQWLMGGVALPNLAATVPALVVVGAALAWALVSSASLQALSLGDELAAGLGVNSDRVGRRAVWWAAALSAVAVSVAGIVGFVGLLVPNALKMWLGRDQRVLLPAAVLFGGGLVAALDGLSRTVAAPAELPLGVLTALAGCPLLFMLLRQSMRAAPLALAGTSGHALEHVSLSMRDVYVEFAGVTAVQAVSAQWQAPALVAVVGANGSGKSTLLRVLAGVLRPTAGTVVAGGRPPAAALAYGDLAWLPQTPTVEAGLTVRELAAIGRHARLNRSWAWRVRGVLPAADANAVEAALACVDLTNRGHVDSGAVSGGERQRALVAMILALAPRIALFDEPTASLDPRQALNLFNRLRTWAHSDGRIVLVATHEHAIALRCADWIVVLAQGHVVAHGAPTDIAVLQALAGSQITDAKE